MVSRLESSPAGEAERNARASASRRARASAWLRRPALCLAAAAVLLVSVASTATAVNSVDTYSYDVSEKFTITLDALGNARYTDVLKYDKAFFQTAGFDSGTYPSLLSRRYRLMVNATEIENFKSKIDTSTATIRLTFDQAGYAYNEGDHWILYDFPDKPQFVVHGMRVFQSESNVTSEFTLGQELAFKTTTYLKLPAGATKIQWDKRKSAITYELAYTAPQTGNVFQNNKAVFIPLFVILLLGATGGGAYALMRMRGRAPAPAQQAALAGAPQAAGIPSGRRTEIAGAAAPAALGGGPDPSLPRGAPDPSLPRSPAAGTGGGPEAGGDGHPSAEGAPAVTVTEETVRAEEPASPPAQPDTSTAIDERTAEARQPAPEGPAAEGSAHGADEPLQATLMQSHFCRHCGAPLPHADSNFCPNCGGQLTSREREGNGRSGEPRSV